LIHFYKRYIPDYILVVQNSACKLYIWSAEKSP